MASIMSRLILKAIITLITIQITFCVSFIGDVCTLVSGSTGTCKLLTDCQIAREELRNNGVRPQNCGFQGSEPIVCCPNPKTPDSNIESRLPNKRVPGVVSKRKCREYSRYVYVRKTQPINMIGAPDVVKYECGHQVVKLIVGGEPAAEKEFPHMAAIGYEPSPNDILYSCGGTIISRDYILTAAHCLSDFAYGDAKWVKMGVVWLTATKHLQVIKVKELIPHPEYKSSSHYHDIGLIKLEESAKMNPFSRPACLDLSSQPTTEMAIATGWGVTKQGGEQSNALLKVTLDLFNHSSCQYSYRNARTRKLKRGIDGDIQICAGSLDEEKDTCQGDSGGPLQIYHISDNVKCMYDVIGVTSFGKGCLGNLGVYVKVSHYIQWIEDIVWP